MRFDAIDVVLAAARPDPTKWVGPGLLALGIILAIAVAMVLLWRNMNKQLRKVDFDDGTDRSGGESPGGSDDSAAEQGDEADHGRTGPAGRADAGDTRTPESEK